MPLRTWDLTVAASCRPSIGGAAMGNPSSAGVARILPLGGPGTASKMRSWQTDKRRGSHVPDYGSPAPYPLR
jgi:hypothetical protein